jgi:inward rectifier potassium channel
MSGALEAIGACMPSSGVTMPRSRYVSRNASIDAIVREGLTTSWHDVYHALVATTWPRFLALIVLAYALINVAFAVAYALVPGSIANARPGAVVDAFFFSVQTLATIGYGSMYPQTLYANVLVAIESTIGILALPIVTGLVFAKFARPTARIVFSDRAIVTVRDGVPSFTFRLANLRRNQIVEARARVVLARQETTPEGERIRRIRELPLERSESPLFALTWVVVHRIMAESPLAGATAATLAESDAEIIVSVVGIDETLSQTVHARWSYLADEIVWGGRYADVLFQLPDGRRRVDYTRFQDIVHDEDCGGASALR